MICGTGTDLRPSRSRPIGETRSRLSTQYYSCMKQDVDGEASLFADGVPKVTQGVPEWVDKTATLSKNALAVAGFLELSAKAMERVRIATGPRRK